MTLSGPQKIPFASQKYHYGDKYQGSAMESNVGVVHTTEGTSLPSYDGGVSAPNATAVPDFKNKKLVWYQHYDVDRSSRALVNKSGGVETNTLNAFQVELVGTCDPAKRVSWGSKKAGVDYIYWPEAPDWALKGVGEMVHWLDVNHHIPAKSSVVWKAYPASYGNSSVRLSGAEWTKYYGWLGHQHVPENDHGDPGNIDFARVLAHANGTVTAPAPKPPTKENPVALSDTDVKKIWDYGIPNRFRLDDDGDPRVIPAHFYLEFKDGQFDELKALLESLLVRVGELEAALAAKPRTTVRKAAE